MKSKHKTRIATILLAGAAALSAVACVVSGFLYFTLYWPFRERFDAEGRYFDETGLVVHNAQTSLLVVPMLAFLALTILFVTAWWIHRKRGIAVGGA